MEASTNFHKFKNFDEMPPSICICPKCGSENEILLDEFRERQVCVSCGSKIEFSKCTIY